MTIFMASRVVIHPWANTKITVMAENDGWDWNAGLVADWRGVSLGVYGTELEAGGRKGSEEGFNVYNYTKFNIAIGYTGNVRDISHGVVLRSRVSELTREPAGRGALSARELQVLRLVAAGKTSREIASSLTISQHTVRRHLENTFAKLGVSSRAAAIAHAYEHDLL